MSRYMFRTLTFALALVVVISFYYNYTFVSNGEAYNTIFRLQNYRRSRVTNDLRTINIKRTPLLGWILHFNYEPHPEAVKTLLHFYAKHFVSVVIVSPTARIGKLLELNTSSADVEVIWAPPCDNKLHGFVAGVMMRCYARGLELLQKSANFHKVEYVVLSNDDVILNMTKVREFAQEGRPVSYATPKEDAPLMFVPPPPWNNSNIPYFKGWRYGTAWPQCQQLFSKVPPKFKQRFLETQGTDKALVGGCDVFFLPSEVVPEFLFLSTIISECWPEIGVPNALAMLSIPVKFYVSPSEVFMYRWWTTLVTPSMFERQLANHSIVSFHPFKLSYPAHRTALAHFMTKYKFGD